MMEMPRNRPNELLLLKIVVAMFFGPLGIDQSMVTRSWCFIRPAGCKAIYASYLQLLMHDVCKVFCPFLNVQRNLRLGRERTLETKPVSNNTFRIRNQGPLARPCTKKKKMARDGPQKS